jgi:hypothetical protein
MWKGIGAACAMVAHMLCAFMGSLLLAVLIQRAVTQLLHLAHCGIGSGKLVDEQCIAEARGFAPRLLFFEAEMKPVSSFSWPRNATASTVH